ncbi:methyltransferase [Bacillus sp. B190/17]|uniref:Methyltransferase n=1 Tax=Bacillus lumedeiriae TaxID=3058829 RepID=A0ABW8IBR6_9BACI
MNEKQRDQQLQIKTTGMREKPHSSIHCNRYEATPYIALDELFYEYELERSDRVVDFGCGKGRLPFYIHDRFAVSVTGIEINEQLYQEALENQKNYMKRGRRKEGSIHFECCPAEKYEIKRLDNRFYFFNPFSIQVFMKVIRNILLSVEENDRPIDVILYYPTTEYVHFLEIQTTFQLLAEVKVRGLYEKNENERFLIFRYD